MTDDQCRPVVLDDLPGDPAGRFRVVFVVVHEQPDGVARDPAVVVDLVEVEPCPSQHRLPALGPRPAQPGHHGHVHRRGLVARQPE
nr:hypothetical protein [Streptomyces sp. G44]